jgi:BASS family bile acid:Na+ symporter
MGAGINVDAGAIARPLALTMLLPLTLALILENLWPGLGNRLDSALVILTNISLIAVIGLTVAVNLPAILGVFGTGAIPAAVLLLIGAFVIGYLSGVFGRDTRDEVGLNTAQRNYAAAIVVASETFGNPDVLAMVVVISVISMLLLFPGARFLKKYSPQTAPKAVPIEISRRRTRAS